RRVAIARSAPGRGPAFRRRDLRPAEICTAGQGHRACAQGLLEAEPGGPRGPVAGRDPRDVLLFGPRRARVIRGPARPGGRAVATTDPDTRAARPGPRSSRLGELSGERVPEVHDLSGRVKNREGSRTRLAAIT